MKPPKLERIHPYEINSRATDQIYLWDSPFDASRQNLTVRDPNGTDVITIYGITKDQLAGLAREIQLVLGTPPEISIHGLKTIHEALGRMIPIESEEYRPIEDVDNL